VIVLNNCQILIAGRRERARWSLVALALAGVAGGVFWGRELRRAALILGECLRPTTVEMMPLPNGCVQTTEVPPSNLMRIVDYQQSFYHLTRQRLVVCVTPARLPLSEPDFTRATFPREVRTRWLPLYVGCCSYQLRRHVAVVAASPSRAGSIVVEGALIQSRWDFFRLNWRSKDRDAWF
jgi:hypothetical protein